MIPRYSRPEMARIWEPETRFRIWLKIETYAAEAMAELGLIPKHAAEAVRKRGGFDIARCARLVPVPINQRRDVRPTGGHRTHSRLSPESSHHG